MSCRKPVIGFCLGFLELARPINCLMAAAATYIGYWLLARPDGRAVLAFVSVFFICAGGNTINDYFDRKIDRKDKPHRPIPSGRIKPSHALFYSVLHFAVGLFVALKINAYAFGIALTSSILLVLYSWSLKKHKAIGNAVVSVLVAMVFLFSQAAAGTQGITMLLAYAAFSSNMAREIAKDLEDIRAREQNTLPKMIGRRSSAGFAIFWLALSMLIGLTAAVGVRSNLFSLLMLAGYASFAYAMMRLFAGQDRPSSFMAQTFIKLGMVLILAAFVAVKIIG